VQWRHLEEGYEASTKCLPKIAKNDDHINGHNYRSITTEKTPFWKITEIKKCSIAVGCFLFICYVGFWGKQVGTGTYNKLSEPDFSSLECCDSQIRSEELRFDYCLIHSSTVLLHNYCFHSRTFHRHLSNYQYPVA